ncbi:MAG: prephenate dehydratase [Bacteroidota bacterium]
MTASTQTAAKRIVIQGYYGAFHEIAARFFFQEKELTIVPANTFDDLVVMAQDDEQSDGAIMAIENSIAGSILYNYQLIHQANLHIVGEVYLRIKQNLMVLPGVAIEELQEVHSHPMAIAQCRAFFRQHPHIRLVETTDTALSAKRIRDGQLRHIGGIASTLAASLYGMEIVGNGIETNKQNYTRFLILDRNGPTEEAVEKVSVSFTLKHEVGSLHQVLATLADRRANLTKIQSMPVVGSQWEYLFFVDFVLPSPDDYNKTIVALQANTRNLNILGKYKIGQHHEY